MQCVTHGGTCAFQFDGCQPTAALPLGELCTWTPPEADQPLWSIIEAGRHPAISAWPAGHPCPVCGHSDLVHIGVEHCPVCELACQATPQYRRQAGADPRRDAGVQMDVSETRRPQNLGEGDGCLPPR